jgi:4-alpha-glucanotransferase
VKIIRMTEPIASSGTWPRLGGLLLHLTSLPGPGGCGDLGPAAHAFLQQLRAGGLRAWQVLPIGPTSYGDSPYQTHSSAAGNPILVSPRVLADEGLLDEADLIALAQRAPTTAVADYGLAQSVRWPLLRRAAERLFGDGRPDLTPLREDFTRYRQAEEDWLEDFALFMAIKEEQRLAPWVSWPAPLRDRHPVALDEARHRLAETIRLHVFVQWQFERQFRALRRAASALDIELIGDVPIFVAHDSIEVWRERDQFLLHGDGRLRVQAGVPPDYFSRTGQLWGNPLYDWKRMQADGFRFWRRRIRRIAKLFDRVRIDHFRGFAAHWEVDGAASTAEHGRWVTAPGDELFTALRDDQNELAADTGGHAVRFIAEDLGVITPDVEALRDRFALPGIRVLVFGFGPDEHYDGRPWAWRRNQVVYTTTHDNSTLCGWYHGEPEGTRTREQSDAERARVHEYLGFVPRREEAHFALIGLALASAADTVIVPVQDVLGLGNAARMNTPGKSEGNWGFRLLPEQLDGHSLARLRELVRIYGRLA